MKREIAQRIVEIYDRIDDIQRTRSFEKTNYNTARFINSETLTKNAKHKILSSEKAILKLHDLIDKLSTSRNYLNAKRLELDIELDQPNLSINKEIQLKAKIELLNEML